MKMRSQLDASTTLNHYIQWTLPGSRVAAEVMNGSCQKKIMTLYMQMNFIQALQI
jgi:hypothetical protein